MGPTDSNSDDGILPSSKNAIKRWGTRWRSHPLFAIVTVGIGMFTDAFLYGLIVPILPSMLEDRVGVPREKDQFYISQLLATFAIASVIFSPIAGVLTDKARGRQMPFLVGLAALIAATILLFTAKTIALLTLARLLQGASTAVVWTVGLALARDTVGPENLGATIGSIFGFVSVGTVSSPVIGGVLYRAAGIRAVAGLALGLLGIDFVMRVLVIEKSDYESSTHISSSEPDGDSNARQSNENTALLGDGDMSDEYLIPNDVPSIIRKVPILYCFRSPVLLTAMFLQFTQGVFMAAFDSTIPLHARKLFDLDSLGSGLLYGPLGLCNLVAGPLAGWAVDRYGTKLVATVGYLWLVPVLALLRVPTAEPHGQQIALYAVLLGCAGAGLGAINSPPIVAADEVIERYHKRNPKFFGPNGPYAQVYGLTNMLFCTGLSVGPLAAGGLRSWIGYGNMNAVLAGFAGITCLMCLTLLSPRSAK